MSWYGRSGLLFLIWTGHAPLRTSKERPAVKEHNGARLYGLAPSAWIGEEKQTVS
jgi:hypothetical protein